MAFTPARYDKHKAAQLIYIEGEDDPQRKQQMKAARERKWDTYGVAGVDIESYEDNEYAMLTGYGNQRPYMISLYGSLVAREKRTIVTKRQQRTKYVVRKDTNI